jgi:hypothetical protein
MQEKLDFQSCQLTALTFDVRALRPLKTLYEQVCASTLPRGVTIGRKDHEEYSGFERVSMSWYYANSPRAIAIFRAVIDGCELKRAREIVGSRPDFMRVVQASFIVTVGSYPRGRWHVDFTEQDLGTNQSATMLTPLFTFQRNFGGLEVSAVKRGMSLDVEEYSQVYRYRDGEAILFDASGMIHRTESYRAGATARRVLVCWQFADTSRRLRPALRRIGRRNGDPMFCSPHSRSSSREEYQAAATDAR